MMARLDFTACVSEPRAVATIYHLRFVICQFVASDHDRLVFMNDQMKNIKSQMANDPVAPLAVLTRAYFIGELRYHVFPNGSLIVPVRPPYGAFAGSPIETVPSALLPRPYQA